MRGFWLMQSLELYKCLIDIHVLITYIVIYTSILLAALMTYRKPVRQTAENLQKYLRNNMLTKLLHTWKWSHNKTHFKMLLMPHVSVKTFRAQLVNEVCAKPFWVVEHFLCMLISNFAIDLLKYIYVMT